MAGMYAAINPETTFGNAQQEKKTENKKEVVAASAEKQKRLEALLASDEQKGEQMLLDWVKEKTLPTADAVYTTRPGRKGWAVGKTSADIKMGIAAEPESIQTMTLYRVGRDPRELHFKYQLEQVPLAERNQLAQSAIADILPYMPELMLYNDSGLDWDKSEILNTLYVAYTYKNAAVKTKIATPRGFIQMTIDDSEPYWNAYREAFQTANDVVRQLQEQYPDALGTALAAQVRTAGANTINIVTKFLYEKQAEERKISTARATIDGQPPIPSPLSSIIKESLDRLNHAHAKATLGDGIIETNPEYKTYSAAAEDAQKELMAEDQNFALDDETRALRRISDAYAIVGIQLEFHLQPKSKK